MIARRDSKKGQQTAGINYCIPGSSFATQHFSQCKALNVLSVKYEPYHMRSYQIDEWLLFYSYKKHNQRNYINIWYGWADSKEESSKISRADI